MLLQLLDLLLVRRLADEVVDVTQRPLSWNLKPSILLPDAIPTNTQRGGMTVARALCRTGGGIGQICRSGHPTLTGLGRHGHGARRRKGHAGTVGGQRRHVDGVHGANRTAGEGSGRAAVQVGGEVVIESGRGTRAGFSRQ